jgi:hypothetical protein
MATSYDAAVSELYQAPLASFVEERKRLAGELKASGDAAGAARLGKLARPPISAWVVNQLWWRERDTFEALFATAERLRQGELAAGAEHRQAIAALRKHAAELLTEGGHGAADATLRRVTTTLSALAVSTGFAPDAPGALSADREAPGFDAVETLVTPAKAAAEPAAAPAPGDRAQARDERRRLEEERKRRLAEQRRLESELRAARKKLETREREVERLKAELELAETGAGETRDAVAELEAGLVRLEEPT